MSKTMRTDRFPSGELINRLKPIEFTFDGKQIDAFEGDTLGSALAAKNIKVLSRSFKYHRPRGLLCVSGQCPNCLVEVNGSPNIRACTTKVENKMEWVGLVTLDSESADGYIRREIPQCRTLPYLPHTSVNVKVFVDMDNCCEGTRDADKCDKSCLKPLNHFHTKQHLEYDIDVKGTTYSRSGHISRRRRLLKHRRMGC